MLRSPGQLLWVICALLSTTNTHCARVRAKHHAQSKSEEEFSSSHFWCYRPDGAGGDCDWSLSAGDEPSLVETETSDRRRRRRRRDDSPSPTPTPPPPSGTPPSPQPPSTGPVNTNTIKGKVLMGYQGWFGAAGDSSNMNWWHWANSRKSTPGPGNLHFDLFPDLKEYPASSLYSTKLKWSNGSTVKLYSNTAPGVVDLHFKWMADYSLDGVLLQRFLTDIKGSTAKRQRDTILKQVAAAARKHKRTWALMWDVTGASESEYDDMIKADWNNLISKYVGKEGYLHEGGKPVVCIFGLGIKQTPQPSASNVVSLLNWLKRRAYVIGSGPYGWRSGDGDSLSNYGSVYKSFDAIMPWAVGRYGSVNSFNSKFNQVVKGDAELCKSRGQDYAPMAFPGFSWENLKGSKFNHIKRLGGEFLRAQINAHLGLKNRGATFYYVAMFDEVDEATALYKAAPSKSDCPSNAKFLYLNIDGGSYPSDHYLKIMGDYTSRAKR